MKKYLIAAALIVCAAQPILAQEAEVFYVILDNTTNQCRVMAGSQLSTTQKLDTKSWANTPRWMRPKQLWTP